jgi:putative glutamine amidotransferase
MKIAITNNGLRNMEHYYQWLRSGTVLCDIVTLSGPTAGTTALAGCHGLVLSGGGDVDPALYAVDAARDLAEDVDVGRDRFEMDVARAAIASGLPILGICRGMQLFNVMMGGTLIIDLERRGFREHRKGKTGDRRHGVSIIPDTNLQSITGSFEGEVNTNHHQAVERPGKELRVSALSDDGVVEGLEWERPAGRPFLQLVQWHPERMVDESNPLRRTLLEAFLREAKQFCEQQSITHT